MKFIKNEYILLDCRFLKLLVQAVLCQLFGVQPGPGPGHIVSLFSTRSLQILLYFLLLGSQIGRKKTIMENW